MGTSLLMGAGKYGIPGFTPLALGDLKAWYKADAGITLNGSTVSQWDDQSGNANHLIQATAVYQPIYVPAGINGLPSVYFKNITGVKTSAMGALLDVPLADLTFVVVLKITAAGLANNYNATLARNTSGNFLHQQVGQNASVGGRGLAFPIVANTFYLRAATQIAAGTEFFSNNVSAGVVSVGAIADGFRYVANGSSTEGYNLEGEIAELLIYSKKLDNAQMSEVSESLNSKYLIY